MIDIIGVDYDNQDIELDGIHFESCRFTNCRLIFHARSPYLTTHCSMTACTYVLEDHAELTMVFLDSLHNQQGHAGRKLAEALIKQVRNGYWVKRWSARLLPPQSN